MLLQFSFFYDGSELAPPSQEKDPRLLFWTSANKGWFEWCTIEWKDKTNPITSKRHSVSVSINPSSLRIDDAIRVESIVLSPNHDKRWVRAKAGSGGFYISDMIKKQLQNPNTQYQICLDLTLQTYQPDETPFLKGRITLCLDNYHEVTSTKWVFQEPTYSLVPKNRSIYDQIITFAILRTMFPYDEKAHEIGGFFPPSDSTVDRVHAPLWINEVGALPGVYYWVDYTNNQPDERFYSNLARIALSRKNVMVDAYIDAVDEQFKIKSDTLTHAFFDATLLLSDMCTIVSTSLPYIGDYTHTGKRGMKNKMNQGEQVSIESFHDALRMLGGDCVASYEQIYTRGGLKCIEDIQVGEEVLSYDFEAQTLVYKCVLNKWDKGYLPLYSVVFNNGSSIDVTSGHPMWLRCNREGRSVYKKTPLNHMSCAREDEFNRKNPIVLNIPYEEKDIEWLTADHCFIIGYAFVDRIDTSEGFITVRGYGCDSHIIPRLRHLKIPFSRVINGDSIPIVRFAAASFKQYIQRIRYDNTHISFSRDLLQLPLHKLKSILNGYFYGDKSVANSKIRIYTASSYVVALQLQEISLRLGSPMSIHKQRSYQGLARNVKYILFDDPSLDFRKDQGYVGLGEATITKIINTNTHAHMYDIEVEDTHAFVFRNGIIGHNCEDLGNLIYRIFTTIEVGRPELANKDDHWTKQGGWNDPLLQRMQKIAKLYVCLGSLGSVVGAYLGQKEKSKMNQPPFIHSKQDYDIELGAHMWCEQVPLVKFEEKMNATNSRQVFSLHPDIPKFAWEHKLPHLVGEGTGYLSPLLKPISDYFNEDPQEAQARVNHYKWMLTAMGHIVKNSQVLAKGQMQRLQTMLHYQPDIRLTTFYRETVHCFTDRFMREGYNFGEFTWTFKSPRIKESNSQPERNSDEWSWGVSMRDKLYDKSNVALVVSPGYTPEELHVAKTHLRHLPPLSNPELQIQEEKKSRMDALCTSFQDKIHEVTQNRIPENPGAIINVIFQADQFTEDEFRDKILSDITKIREIYEVQVKHEYITSEIQNVCLNIWISVPIDQSSASNINGTINQNESQILHNLDAIGYSFWNQCPNLAYVNGHIPRFTVLVEWTNKGDPKTKSVDTFYFHTQVEADAFKRGVEGSTPVSKIVEAKLAYKRGYNKSQKYAQCDNMRVIIQQTASSGLSIESNNKQTKEAIITESYALVSAGPVRRSRRIEDKSLDEDQQKLDKFKKKYKDQAAILIHWEGYAQGSGEYTQHQFDTQEQMEAFLKGLDDGSTEKGNNEEDVSKKLKVHYKKGYLLAQDKLDDELFYRVVYKQF